MGLCFSHSAGERGERGEEFISCAQQPSEMGFIECREEFEPQRLCCGFAPISPILNSNIAEGVRTIEQSTPQVQNGSDILAP